MTVVRQQVQPGSTQRIRIEVDASSPLQTGRAGAFLLQEATITVGAGVPTDLTTLSTSPWVVPAMPERAYPQPVSAASASCNGVPTFVSGGGPGGEDYWDLPVVSSAGWSVSDYLRGATQPEGQGQVYKVLLVPDGTTIRVHGKTAGMDIVSGDTIEEVIGLGIYVGLFDLIVDDYLNAGSPEAQLIITLMMVSDGGVDPQFDAQKVLVWTYALHLDVGRAFRAG